MSEEEKEELKKAIEELPEEERVGETEERVEETEESVGETEERVEETEERVEEREKDEYERMLEEFRKRRNVFKEVADFVNEIASMPPERLDAATKVFEKLMPEQKQPVEKHTERVVVEKPVIPEEVKEKIERIEDVDEKIERLDARLSQYDKVLDKLTALSTGTINLATEVQKLRSELEDIRRESAEREQRLKEEFMIVTKARAQRPDGTIVEEYDYHPKLKAIEKQADFTFNQLGPTLIQEIRATRADISSTLNRAMAMIESIVSPELRRRAPRVVEDIEERFKRLVGGLTPEQRMSELGELEKKIEKEKSEQK
jgi:cell division protein ZapA (FtsZ GTPase activity inhibitor)